MPSRIPKNGINTGQFKKGVIAYPETLFTKGQKSWNEGKKATPEAIINMSKAHLGKPSNMKGKKFPFKERPKAKGRKVWNKGVKMPQITGAKCHLWKGGITPENIKIRHSLEMKLWRKSVFERDNFTCQKYNTKVSGSLRAHHINNFADFPELRTSIENGITLSEKAHIEFHKKYGFKNNSREQLQEFLNNK